MTGAATFIILIVLAAAQTIDSVRELAARGDMKAALQAGERLVQENPTDGEAWYVLGVVRAALQDTPGAFAAYQNAVLFAPENADAWNNLGDLFRRNGKLKEALDALNKASALDPKQPRISLNLALVSIELKEFEKALGAISRAEAGMGPGTMFDYLRAKVYLETSDVPNAQPFINRVRKATPQSPAAFLDLAKLLLARSEYKVAAELLLSLQPDRQEPGTQFVLGQAWYAMDQMEKAREIFDRLAAGDPGNAVFLTWKGHAERALGSTANARAAYEKAVRLDGAQAGPLTELADLELEAGRSEEAHELVSRALSLSPDDSRTQFVAGLVGLRLQRWDDAVRALQKITAEALEYPQAQYLLSRAYRQLGNTARADAALDEFKRVSNGDVTSPARRRVR